MTRNTTQSYNGSFDLKVTSGGIKLSELQSLTPENMVSANSGSSALWSVDSASGNISWNCGPHTMCGKAMQEQSILGPVPQWCMQVEIVARTANQTLGCNLRTTAEICFVNLPLPWVTSVSLSSVMLCALTVMGGLHLKLLSSDSGTQPHRPGIGGKVRPRRRRSSVM